MDESPELDRILGLPQASEAAGLSPVLLDHARNPRNVGGLADADGFATVLGACGDSMDMWIKVKDGTISRIAFWTDGCGTTIACGSVATEMARGKPIGEASRVTAEDIARALGGLPEEHVHCAGLAASTLKKAIFDYLNTRDEPWKRAYRAK